MSAPSRRRDRAVVFAAVVAMSVLLVPPAAAAAPSAPVLVGPSDGGTTTGAAPTLSVTASDPDGGPVQVRFEGRKVGATTPAPGSADPFTVVALPDTQNYTYSGRQGMILQQTNWTVDTRAALRTAFVVQLGDLVSDWFKPEQWQYISDGLKVLDDAAVPNSVVPGNHDFDNVAQDVGPYDTYFPVSRYAGASWNGTAARYGGHLGQNQFGPDPVDRRNMDNYALFTAGGRDFLVLNLEWEAPQYALDWAGRVLAAYPDRIAIMATHSFVTVAGGRMTSPQRTGGTSTSRMWSEFVSTHCSIKLVLSGHEHNGDAGEARRTDANTCGAPVQQILTDYQARANGGDGWLRYYTFDPAANTMKATTYSPKLGTYETDADSSFTLPFDLGSATPAPFTTIGTATVASGGVAAVRWTGLDPDTRYEWRAVADDGTDSSTSQAWTLRTPAAAGGVDDTFTRDTTGSWGNADTGQPWSVVPASAFSVDGSRGRFALPLGATRRAQLPDVALKHVLISTDLSLSPVTSGSGVYAVVQGRTVATGQYRAKLRYLAGGAVTIAVVRIVNGVESALSTTRTVGTVGAGTSLKVQLEITGTAPTTVRAKAWLAADPEPSAWTVSGADSTAALQGPGGVGLEAYLSSAASAPASITLDRFTAADAGTAPPPPPPPPPPPLNQPPTAVVGPPTVTERAVTVSGSGSSDTDGSVVGWSWTFGDGGTASGVTADHTYTADGSYPVTLTVTDDDGATATATRTVTVAATPPPTTELAADPFSRITSGGWGSAVTGGAWSLTGATDRFAVTGGTGRQILTPGKTADAALTAVRSASAELRADISWDRPASEATLYSTFVIRAVPTGSYRAALVVSTSGVPRISFIRKIGTTETTLAAATVSGQTVTPGTWSQVSVRAVAGAGGTTTLSAKVWPRGGTEPASAQVTTTDATAALQAAGWVGLGSYRSSSATTTATTSFDDLRVVPVG